MEQEEAIARGIRQPLVKKKLINVIVTEAEDVLLLSNGHWRANERNATIWRG